MFDTRPALADMASQIRAFRTSGGLTLQELASRSGVAASTIHKVESQQMVPTVSVLLKIAKGLDARPEDLIRDNLERSETNGPASDSEGQAAAVDGHALRRAGVWRITLDNGNLLPLIALGADQRAMVLVEKGPLHLQTGTERVEINAGECLEIRGGQHFKSMPSQPGPALVTLIVSPPGDLEGILGAPKPLDNTTD